MKQRKLKLKITDSEKENRMKKVIFLIVAIMLLVPSGIVSAQDNCPSNEGWICETLPEGSSVVGEYLIVQDLKNNLPIQAIWINGILYEEDTTEEDPRFFISGLGTTRVEILQKNKITKIGVYIPGYPTATPVATATPTITSIPTNTVTPIPTATAIETAIPVATPTSVATTTETLSATKPTTILVAGILFLALGAITIIALIVRKKGH